MPTNSSILLLALACIPTYSAAGPSLGFPLSLHPQSSPVKAGAELRLTTTIANVSDHEIRLAKSLGALDEALTYEIEIRDASGQEPPITPYFRELQDKNYGLQSYATFFLEPGKSLDESLAITKLYTLSPGEYTVRVIRATRPLWQLLDKDKEKVGVKSNTVTLTVVP